MPVTSSGVTPARFSLLAVTAMSAAGETLDRLSRRYRAGRRTLERLFRNETGLSFGLWRQKARMLDSVRLLSEGESVTDAALDSGYNSVSAFIGQQIT